MTQRLDWTSTPAGALSGSIRVPGDKSISHRAMMFGSLAEGTTRVSGFLEGEDTLATAAAFRAMGVTIEAPNDGERIVHGVGLHGLKAPSAPLDLGNAGTGMRLIAGLMAGQKFPSVLIGDESLSRRPMRRVIEPLAMMGARIDSNEGGRAPLRITPAALHGIDYRSPVASAQVKSCVLLAGLYADGVTRVAEPHVTRDHTERMLAAFNVPILRDGDFVGVRGGSTLRASSVAVPSDISSAAFFLVAASIASGSELTLREVGVNPLRTGILRALDLMGAKIERTNERLCGGELVADLHVRAARLNGIDVPLDIVPDMIDEFPILFVAAACARGDTLIRGAAELRVKESDRIAVMAKGLRALGIDVEERDDGALIKGGGRIKGGEVDSAGDHRCAMAFAVAGLVADGPVKILDCANVATSFPGFVDLARTAGLRLD